MATIFRRIRAHAQHLEVGGLPLRENKIGEIRPRIDEAVGFVLEAADRDARHANAGKVASDGLYSTSGDEVRLSGAIGFPVPPARSDCYRPY